MSLNCLRLKWAVLYSTIFFKDCGSVFQRLVERTFEHLEGHFEFHHCCLSAIAACLWHQLSLFHGLGIAQCYWQQQLNI